MLSGILEAFMNPALPSVIANSCHPKLPCTISPSLKSGILDSITWEMVLERITSPIWTGGM